MKTLGPVHYIIHAESITFYWEKDDAWKDPCRFEVLLGGERAGITDKTHFTLRGLQPDTTCHIQIMASCGPVSAKSEVLSLTTGKLKKLRDITQAPYFAVGDGMTMNTGRIQWAIDDCVSDEAVYIPEGIFMTGALKLHSGMELYLDEGAVLQGTDSPEDYLPRVWSRFEGTELSCYSSLLNMGELDRSGGYNCHDVVIRGAGTIASGGRSLAERVIAAEHERLRDYLAELGDTINECEKPETIPGRVRPRLINMSNCQNITLSGVTFRNGASWNVHFIYSDGIITHGCDFHSDDVWNGDGWDPDSSTNSTIFDCTFCTGDDSIAIKSGKNPEGNLINRPTEHIRIFDCRCKLGHGIAMGSEMSGGIRDVRIWDCDLASSQYGIEIKGTKKRGGYVRDVYVHDCVVPRILIHSVAYNDDGIAAPKPPVFSDCSFKRLRITAEYQDHDMRMHPCQPIELLGFDEPAHELSDIVFEDVTIGIEGKTRVQSVWLQHSENITLKGIRCL